MKEIKALIRPARLYSVIVAVRGLAGVPGLTVSEVRGFPQGHADPTSRRHGIDAMDSVEMMKIECVVPDNKASAVTEAIERAAHTGNPGDGKIFISDVEEAVKIRTGRRGEEAISLLGA